MSDQAGTDKFVEVEGHKYKEDPENEGQALKDKDGVYVDFEEKEDDEVKETEEEKTAREKKEKEEEDKDPPVRKSVKDQIINRKNRKIKRLEDKKEREAKKKGEEDDESEFSNKGNKEIEDKLNEKINPILDQVRGDADERELGAVLKKYGDSAKDLEKTIRKYMTNSAYEKVPIEFIYLGLVKQVIDKAEVLAKKKKEADDEAEINTTGGTQKRPKKLSKIPDVSNMTNAEVIALANKVKSGQF